MRSRIWRTFPFGDQAAPIQEDDRSRQCLDLVEDMAGDQHGPALAAPFDDEIHELAAGDRVGPRERLVEEEHLGRGPTPGPA